ncbi:MAG: formylglycine-generating enzyme family protein [Candidatus Nealsonbacteria bacterium]|nr:formylglycine-generating enzyme family protein [Candidatus Nealsonbacteria bacterium]
MLVGLLATTCMTAMAVTPGTQTDTITHGGVTITMDFVSVGNTDNVADDTGYGAVDYSYNIGKYEVTENQWDAVSGIAGDLLEDSGYWSGDQPVAAISWYEAAMFCNWLTSGDVTDGAYTINGSGEVTEIDRDSAVSTYGTTYVIPTENEWYKAAFYDGGTSTYYNYPTGSDLVPDGIDYNGDATFDALFNDGYRQGHPNDVDIAGVLSPYGTMGQGGNVWEWNETPIGSSRGLRGGNWHYNSDTLHASYRYGYTPTYEYYSVGFRVASVPEPGSITLLLCGLVAGLIWWRRGK